MRRKAGLQLHQPRVRSGVLNGRAPLQQPFHVRLLRGQWAGEKVRQQPGTELQTFDAPPDAQEPPALILTHIIERQASERRLGEFFKRKTLMFNGYADQVASLYNGMDLRKNY